MNLLIDCDCGADDALALALLCRSEHRILGVSTCFGGYPPGKAAQQAAKIVGGLPVCAGASAALLRERGPVHSSDHWAWRSLPPGEFLRQQLQACGAPVTLLATAPLTNVAALLQTGAAHPEHIVIMGGGISGGNRTKDAEFNFWCDPEAADAVLCSGCRITLLPLEAARDCILDENDIADFPSLPQQAVRRQFAFASATGCGDGHSAIPYDAVAAAGLIDPAVFASTRQCSGRVVCSGQAEGALRITQDCGPVRLVEYADPVRFRQVLFRLLCADK